MKIRFNFNNTSLKIGHDGRIEAGRNKKDPKSKAFCEIDLDLLSMIYGLFHGSPYNISKFMKIPIFGGPTGSPPAAPRPNQYFGAAAGHILATGHDIFNYIARLGAANFQIQYVLKFDGHLDRGRLLQAITLAVVEEPVLGCRFAENDPPFWKPFDNMAAVEFCSFEAAADPEPAILRFLETPLDMDVDPVFKLKLISSGPSDTLCLKANHVCVDGTGAKEIIELLSKIYTTLDGNDIYVPTPSVRSRSDQDRLFAAVGIRNTDAAWNPLLEVPKSIWDLPWLKDAVKTNVTRVAMSRVPYGVVDDMVKYAKSKGATANDYVITAYFRAMFEMSQPTPGKPMDIAMTVDLRRYLPNQKADAIRCFSGGVVTRLARVVDEPFEGTLSRVVPMMNAVKNSNPGVQSAIGLERVEKAKFFETLDFYKNMKDLDECADKCSPILSNLSYLRRTPFRFGRCNAVDAYVIPPAIKAPGLLLCVGTYNGIITLTYSYFEYQYSRKDIEKLLSLIRKELIEGCKGI